jgi:hypothetical protein
MSFADRIPIRSNSYAPGSLEYGVELDQVLPFRLDSDGTISWGDGQQPHDVSLARTGAGVLNVTGTSLELNGVPVGGGGGGSISSVDTGFDTSGDVTLQTTLTVICSDLTIAAVTGDLLVLTIEALLNTAGDDCQFEAATRVAGADVNYFSTAGPVGRAPGGIPAWYVQGGRFEGPRSNSSYRVQAGDLAAGFVTVQPYAFTATGTHTLFRNANYPVVCRLDNYGQA